MIDGGGPSSWWVGPFWLVLLGSVPQVAHSAHTFYSCLQHGAMVWGLAWSMEYHSEGCTTEAGWLLCAVLLSHPLSPCWGPTASFHTLLVQEAQVRVLGQERLCQESTAFGTSTGPVNQASGGHKDV